MNPRPMMPSLQPMIEQKQYTDNIRQLITAETFFNNHILTLQLREKDLLEPIVHWSKSLDSFCFLCFEDQMNLLKSSFCQLFLLSYYTLSHFIPTTEECDDNPQMRILRNLIDRLRALKLDTIEIGCIKTLLLFNRDNQEILDLEKIETNQDKFFNTFLEYERNKGMYTKDSRIGRILLVLSSVRGMKTESFIRKFLHRLFENPASIDNIFRQILSSTERRFNSIQQNIFNLPNSQTVYPFPQINNGCYIPCQGPPNFTSIPVNYGNNIIGTCSPLPRTSSQPLQIPNIWNVFPSVSLANLQDTYIKNFKNPQQYK
uniref:NR LBD domain-containing protein n=1 Tax=Parastrongyloides trichosuri TaxID=131310 RepID=A0A0N4ZME2_PARTI